MTPTRIYVVTSNEGRSERLVEASNKAQAIGHVVADLFRANVASQSTLVELLQAGVKVERAGGAA